MPITYQPPGGAGNTGAEMVVQAAEDRQRRGLQQQQMALAYAESQERTGLQRQQMAQQAYQFEESRKPSARDAWESQAHVQQALAINQGQLSQAEEMRLQRLNSSISSIQQAVDSGQISPEDGKELTSQARGWTTPTELKKARLQVLRQQQEYQHAQQTNSYQAMTNQQNAQVAAQGANSIVQPFYDPHVLASIQSELSRDPAYANATPQQLLQIAQARAGETPNGILGHYIPEYTQHGTHMRFVSRYDMNGGASGQGAAREAEGGATGGTGGAGAGGTGTGTRGRPAVNLQHLWDNEEKALVDQRPKLTDFGGANPTPAQRTAYRTAMGQWHDTIAANVGSAARGQGGLGSGASQQQGQGDDEPTPAGVLAAFGARINELPEARRGEYRNVLAQAQALVTRSRGNISNLRPEDQSVWRFLMHVIERAPLPQRQGGQGQGQQGAIQQATPQQQAPTTQAQPGPAGWSPAVQGARNALSQIAGPAVFDPNAPPRPTVPAPPRRTAPPTPDWGALNDIVGPDLRSLLARLSPAQQRQYFNDMAVNMRRATE